MIIKRWFAAFDRRIGGVCTRFLWKRRCKLGEFPSENHRL
jgi:hypothetical protein